MGLILDLLKDFPLSALQKERFALQEAKLQGKLDALQSENQVLRTGNQVLRTENKDLQVKLEQLESEVEQVRRDQEDADRKRQQELARADRMEPDRETILKVICFHPGLEIAQVAGIASLGVQLAQWHVDALESAKLIRLSYTAGTQWAKGGRFLDITESGRDYLARNDLLHD